MTQNPSPATETLIAASISLLVEAVVVLLFFAAGFTLIAIYATRGM